jgi:hypothetical protein
MPAVCDATSNPTSHATRQIHVLLIAAALGGPDLILEGCASHAGSAQDDPHFPERIVVPPCVGESARVKLLAVNPDYFHYKPSANLGHFLLDLQVRTTLDAWLLVNDETFPTDVNEVAEAPDGTWLFGGNDNVNAWPLGRSADLTLTGLKVATSTGQIPVILAKIEIAGMSPQRWLGKGGHGDHRTTYTGKMVHSDIEVICASWFDVRASAQLAIW